MSNRNRNPVLNASLAAINSVIIDAGTRRDGTGVARCESAITILCAMRDELKDEQAARRAEVTEIFGRALETAFFAKIHDQFADGEINMEAYRIALEDGREMVRELYT